MTVWLNGAGDRYFLEVMKDKNIITILDSKQTWKKTNASLILVKAAKDFIYWRCEFSSRVTGSCPAVAVFVSVPLHPSGIADSGVSTFLIMLTRYKACLFFFFPFLDLLLGDKRDVGHVSTVRCLIQPINTKLVVAAEAEVEAAAWQCGPAEHKPIFFIADSSTRP